MFGVSRLYIAAGALVAIAAVAFWLRADAVSDFRKKLEAARTEHIEDAREIENEIRNLSDDDVLNCLLGRKC